MIEDLKLAVGRKVSFLSQRNGRVYAKLLSFNDAHIQVSLTHDLWAKTRTWFAGDVRLFDMDKISEFRVTAPEDVPKVAVKAAYKPRTKSERLGTPKKRMEKISDVEENDFDF